MVDITSVYAALRAAIEADPPTLNSVAIPLRWQLEEADTPTNPIPDTPSPFAYFEVEMDRGFLAGFGGGRFSNLWRHPGDFLAYVFVPTGWGLSTGLNLAEQIASTLRSYRDSNISCFSASVEPLGKGAELVPDGMRSAVGNYLAVLVVVEFHFDQIG